MITNRVAGRRQFTCWSSSVAGIVTAVVLMLGACPAWAGSYLDRAALLLDEVRREADLIQPRSQDKELVSLVRAISEARVRAAAQMEVPASVGKAHPHLLLVLTNLEQAAKSAMDGNFHAFLEHLGNLRDEERTYRAILSELGFALPERSSHR